MGEIWRFREGLPRFFFMTSSVLGFPIKKARRRLAVGKCEAWNRPLEIRASSTVDLLTSAMVSSAFRPRFRDGLKYRVFMAQENGLVLG